MGGSTTRKKVTSSGKGVNSLAESTAKEYGLSKTSGYRSPEESKSVGGYETDDHTKGNASDFSGSPAKMEEFAQWAVASGKYKKVIWKGRDLISGTKISGHDDHVHLSW